MKTHLTKLVCTLALLATVANAPAYPTPNLMTLHYSGYFGSAEGAATLGATTLPDNTAFSFAATFNAADPLQSINGLAIFSASSLTFLIAGNSYSASSPASLLVGLVDPAFNGPYIVGLGAAADPNQYVQSYYSGATPTFHAESPTPTAYSGFMGNDWKENFSIPLVGVEGGLVIKDLSTDLGATSANLTASVPEPSQWAAISCFGILGLVCVAKRRLTKATR